MKRVYGFRDCGLCYGTGSIENLATGNRESCWLCVERATRSEPDEEVAPTPAAHRPRTTRGIYVSRPPNPQEMAPERAATFLRAGLWLALGLAGFALIRFTKSDHEDNSRKTSDELESLGTRVPGTKTTAEYSAWEPAQ
jgi:hypothetical protein